MAKNFTIVGPNEAHVISGGKSAKVYDGYGRYVFMPFLYKRIIMSKTVIEVSIPMIRLHDRDNLPFAVEISCKVQISDPAKAAETLGHATAAEIRPIVDDTIQSAARSQAMLHELTVIMRDRDKIEESIYSSTTDSLARIGIKVTLFDIKNIIDVEGSSVISDLERVRSAEINKDARIAEANQTSEAEIVEAKKRSEAEISKQESFRASEEARYKQELYIAEQRRQLTLKEMEVLDADTRRKQEIEKERLIIEAQAIAEQQKLEAQGKAEARIIEAKAQAEATKLKAEAEAESIKLKLEAEAEGTEKIALALQKLDAQGVSVKIAEIYADAQKVVSENIARGIQSNTKLFLPMGAGSNSLLSLIPTIETMKEAGLSLSDLVKNEKK